MGHLFAARFDFLEQIFFAGVVLVFYARKEFRTESAVRPCRPRILLASVPEVSALAHEIFFFRKKLQWLLVSGGFRPVCESNTRAQECLD